MTNRFSICAVARPVVAAILATATIGTFAFVNPTELVQPDPTAYRIFGRAMAGVGDQDGDGAGDLLVGRSRAVYAYSGRTCALTGITSGSQYFGMATVGIPDLDGDGIEDVAVGAPNEAGVGAVYVYSSNTSNTILAMTPPVLQTNGGFGTAIAPMPDITGDGKPDLIVGAPGMWLEPAYQGRVFMVSGADGSEIRRIEAPAPTSPKSGFGAVVASCADLNGDSVPEVVATAPFRDAAGYTEAGVVYVFSGADGALLRTFDGPQPNAGFGYSACVLNDMNGDSFPELLVGAPGTYPPPSIFNTGGAYVLSLTPGGGQLPMPGWFLGPGSVSYNDPWGDTQIRYFGMSVARLGDLDGDDRDEFAIGAATYDYYSTDAGHGRAIVFSSRSQQGTYYTGMYYATYDYYPVIQVLRSDVPGASAGTYGVSFGLTLAAVPDVNDDGTTDLAVADPYLTVGGAISAGTAYVYVTTPSLSLAPASLEFGNWCEGAASAPEQGVGLTNSGFGSARFTGSGCEIVGADASSFELVPPVPLDPVVLNETRTFMVRFAPTTLGEKNAVLRIATNDNGGTTRTVPLHGTKVSISVEPRALAFGSLESTVSASQVKTFVITNGGGTPLTFTGSAIAIGGPNAADFMFDPLPSLDPIPPLGSRTVSVKFAPVSNGPKQAVVAVTTSDAGEPSIDVALSGYAVWVDPAAHNFGRWYLPEHGPSTPLDVVVTNRSSAPLAFAGAGVTLSSPHFRFSSAPDVSPILGGATRTFVIEFAPTVMGDLSAVLTVMTTNADEPNRTVSLQGTGFGVPDRAVFLSGYNSAIYVADPKTGRRDFLSYTNQSSGERTTGFIPESTTSVLVGYYKPGIETGILRVHKRTGERTVLYSEPTTMSVAGALTIIRENAGTIIYPGAEGLARLHLDTMTTSLLKSYLDLNGRSPASYVIRSMDMAPDGTLVFANRYLRRLNLPTGAVTDICTSDIKSLAVEKSGNIVALSGSSYSPGGMLPLDSVLRIDPATAVHTVLSNYYVPPQTPPVSLHEVSGLSLDADGSIIVYCVSGLVRVDPTTGYKTTISASSGGPWPSFSAEYNMPHGVSNIAADYLDTDNDTQTDYCENHHPASGDGNADGTSDSQQVNVVSAEEVVGSDYVTLAVPAGVRFTMCSLTSPVTPPLPPGVTLPFGAISFQLEGVTPGGFVDVEVFWTGHDAIDSYYKLVGGVWEKFINDGTTGLISIDPVQKRLVIRVQDGGRGDSDSTPGTITDPGGPAGRVTSAGNWSLFQ